MAQAPPDPSIEEETDESLVAEAVKIFGNLVGDDGRPNETPAEPDIEDVIAGVPPEQQTPAPAPKAKGRGKTAAADVEPEVTAAADTAMRMFGRPDSEDFVQVRGGAMYLPARRRVQWMRGEVVEHPDWTIDTREIKVIEGVLVNNNKVTGGYARIEANIYDETGRLIATGRKTEYSERFTDFVEKAETGAVARAMALAGYGTEAALDLDEGLEGDRIADAPVQTGGRPINITQSAIPGIQAGGRSENITDAQIAEISRYARVLSLGLGVAEFITSVTGTEIDFPSGSDAKVQQQMIIATLKSLTFEQGGQIIGALATAAKSKT